MEHNYESQIKCPYCDWEDRDSWELDENEAIVTCGGCEKEFNVTREIEVTYSTSRIKCEDDKHNYQFENHFASKRNFKNGVWNDLPEIEWTYHRIEMCAECGDKKYIDIVKNEYESALTKI